MRRTQGLSKEKNEKVMDTDNGMMITRGKVGWGGRGG